MLGLYTEKHSPNGKVGVTVGVVSILPVGVLVNVCVGVGVVVLSKVPVGVLVNVCVGVGVVVLSKVPGRCTC